MKYNDKGSELCLQYHHYTFGKCVHLVEVSDLDTDSEIAYGLL